jgi:hypothetical protein
VFVTLGVKHRRRNKFEPDNLENPELSVPDFFWVEEKKRKEKRLRLGPRWQRKARRGAEGRALVAASARTEDLQRTAGSPDEERKNDAGRLMRFV